MRLPIIILFTFFNLLGQAQVYKDFKTIENSINFSWPLGKDKNINPNWLLGLKPDYKIESKWNKNIPIAIPIDDKSNPSPQMHNHHDCIRISEGMTQYCLNYLIINGNDSILVDSEYKFRKIFSPIESEIEAISFIFALTDYYPIFDLNFLNKREWVEFDVSHKWLVYQPEIETSYVHKTKDGYELLLYWYQVFGCSHPYFSAIFDLKTDGSYTIRNKKIVFEDKQEPGICVD
jgi:hypothetical protein